MTNLLDLLKSSEIDDKGKMAGFTVDKVHHKITCKTCLSRIERLLNNVDES